MRISLFHSGETSLDLSIPLQITSYLNENCVAVEISMDDGWIASGMQMAEMNRENLKNEQ